MKPCKEMYEYFDSGKNINNREIESINTTRKAIKEIKQEPKETLIKVMNSIELEMIKSYLTGRPLEKNLEKIFSEWDKEKSLKKVGDGIEMVENFINRMKEYEEYIQSYVFKEDKKINIWAILSDSTCDNGDKMYEEFIELFDENLFNFVVYDISVKDAVLKEINAIDKDYKEYR